MTKFLNSEKYRAIVVISAWWNSIRFLSTPSTERTSLQYVFQRVIR
ncbi:MAG TPA: hypothetical protein VIQ51_01650 [Chryseosolibacter sp.]